MSTLTKSVYFLRIILPFAFAFLIYAGGLFEESWVLNDYIGSFRMTMLYLLAELILVIMYIRHLYKNPAISDRTIWLLALLFLSFPATIIYWWRWIRTA